MNEYFIDVHICDIFKAVLESAFYPEQWTEGIIINLHKKAILMTSVII